MPARPTLCIQGAWGKSRVYNTSISIPATLSQCGSNLCPKNPGQKMLETGAPHNARALTQSVVREGMHGVPESQGPRLDFPSALCTLNEPGLRLCVVDEPGPGPERASSLRCILYSTPLDHMQQSKVRGLVCMARLYCVCTG